MFFTPEDVEIAATRRKPFPSIANYSGKEITLAPSA
jgi:hypothetical protein